MNKVILSIILATTILLPGINLAYAAPFPPNVVNDVYGVGQGGAVNGIPTANDDNDGIPDINDALNQLTGGAVARNVGYDNLFVEPDDVWQEMGSGTVALIGLTAGNNNLVGVYTDIGTGTVKIPVLGPFSGTGFAGDGSMAMPYPAGLTGLLPNQNFGWYLDSTSGAGTTTYFSEAALNPALLDHMMTFDLSSLAGQTIHVSFGGPAMPLMLGSDTFLIAWEDLPFDPNTQTLGDDDYDDMMYLITSVDPAMIQEVGGEFSPIDTTALLVSGLQSGLVWFAPLILAGAGFAAYKLRRT